MKFSSDENLNKKSQQRIKVLSVIAEITAVLFFLVSIVQPDDSFGIWMMVCRVAVVIVLLSIVAFIYVSAAYAYRAKAVATESNTGDDSIQTDGETQKVCFSNAHIVSTRVLCVTMLGVANTARITEKPYSLIYVLAAVIITLSCFTVQFMYWRMRKKVIKKQPCENDDMHSL